MTRRFPRENEAHRNHAAANNIRVCPPSTLPVPLDPRGTGHVHLLVGPLHTIGRAGFVPAVARVSLLPKRGVQVGVLAGGGVRRRVRDLGFHRRERKSSSWLFSQQADRCAVEGALCLPCQGCLCGGIQRTLARPLSSQSSCSHLAPKLHPQTFLVTWNSGWGRTCNI